MDLEERERFFAAGGPAGRFDGPPGGPPGGMGPPGGGRAPPPHPSEHTPQSQNDWGPSREGRESSREVLARQRQAEYNEQKARQERNREAALEQKRRGGAMSHDHGDPRFAHGGGETRDLPGMMFDENNEQRPRPKGFHGLRDIHDASDAKRRVAADEKKRAYAADLQRQIDEAKTRKQLAKQRSLDVDRHNLGMHNIILDMRGDGRLDGFDERGNSMGYTYADAHPPDAPRPYHPTNDGSVRTYDDDAHDAHDVHANHHEAPQHDPRSAAASAHQNARVPRGSLDARAPSERGYVGPPGGHFADGVAAGARAEKMRKKQAYQRDLELQIAEKARRKAAEKLAQQELDSRDARAAMRHDPWGPVSRGRGAGARPWRTRRPLRTRRVRVPATTTTDKADKASLRTANRQSRTTARWYPRVETRTRRKSSPADARACPATAASRRARRTPTLAGGPGERRPRRLARRRVRARARGHAPRGA